MGKRFRSSIQICTKEKYSKNLLKVYTDNRTRFLSGLNAIP